MLVCKECGFINPCVDNESILCAECNHNFNKCIKCATPCRDREEQQKIFIKLNPSWNEK